MNRLAAWNAGAIIGSVQTVSEVEALVSEKKGGVAAPAAGHVRRCGGCIGRDERAAQRPPARLSAEAAALLVAAPGGGQHGGGQVAEHAAKPEGRVSIHAPVRGRPLWVKTIRGAGSSCSCPPPRAAAQAKPGASQLAVFDHDEPLIGLARFDRADVASAGAEMAAPGGPHAVVEDAPFRMMRSVFVFRPILAKHGP
jgi:hypothetical protein